jgi:hypothetical protein
VFSHSGAERMRPSLLIPGTAEAGFATFAGVLVRDVAAGHVERAPVEGEDADDGVEQLALAVALDAGDADDLAGANTERHVVEHRALTFVDREILRLSSTSRRTVDCASRVGAHRHREPARCRASSPVA